MATDMAADSDSTLRNSALSSSLFTIADSASTMWVCGVIGYAQITCGRHIATASATARDPSICLSIGLCLSSECLSLVPDEVECGPGGGAIALRDLPGEPLVDRGQHRVQADRPGQRGEPAEQGGAGQRSAEVGHGQRAGRDDQEPVPAEAGGELAQAQLGEAAGGGDEHVAVAAEPLEQLRQVH